MPIYEYQCEDCGKVIEAMQRLSEPLLTTCGDLCAAGGTGSGKVHKIISATNIGKTTGPYGGMPMSTDAPTCGSCGRAPGSCASD